MDSQKARVLIFGDERNICATIANLMQKEGIETMVSFGDGESPMMGQSSSSDLVQAEMMLPGPNGSSLPPKTQDLNPNHPVVFITVHTDSQGGSKAIKERAHDYLSNPFNSQEIRRADLRASAERSPKIKAPTLSAPLKGSASLAEKMGPSHFVARLASQVKQVAESDFSVIITGETGSGKEVIARAIHETSPRSKGPFIPVDCGAIPEKLLESELFGYERGAFTGAEAQKPGKFQLAQGGTLFLDEISNMPLSSQAKLLRVLQEKRVYRVGGTKPIQMDVRLLVASNQNLKELTTSGAFRQDLFYRLNEFTISIPPLRDRKEDIPYLAKRFLSNANKELNKQVKGFSKTVINTLIAYSWPGNVRQLRSIIRRAALLADKIITEKHLELRPVDLSRMAHPRKVQGTPWKEILEQSITAVEREVYTQLFKETGGNKSKAARLLEVDYSTLHRKVKKLGIRIDNESEPEITDQGTGKTFS